MKQIFTKKTTLIILLLLGSLSYAQNVLNGIVKDGNGNPLEGAIIEIEDSGSITLSNENGEFSLTVDSAPPFQLIISSDGYTSEQIVYHEFPDSIIEYILLAAESQELSGVTITARRRNEKLQDVPIPIAVVSGKQIEETGAFNVSRLKEIVPSVQFYSHNARNTNLSIRGLGSNFGSINDGIEQGVGFYVDGVYYSRPAAASLDFVDVERIEVLRGPQGTLFGKNTTAGAFNITTRKPEFKTGGVFEGSYGNYGFIQAKASFTGPLSQKTAFRLSLSGTHRDGLIYNTRSQTRINDLNNIGIKTQLLYNVSDKVDILFSADFNRQRPTGYAWVYAGTIQNQLPEIRNISNVFADLNYTLPSTNPFDRVNDTDGIWRSHSDVGGVSANVNIKLGKGTLTSTTAWRFWDWDPANDADLTGLDATRIARAPAKHRQFSQELRWSGDLSSKLSSVFGVFAFYERLRPDGAHQTEFGADQWRFVQNSQADFWYTPGFLDGYGVRQYPKLNSFSGAVFGQVDWAINNKFHLLAGARLNYDEKEVDYKREAYGHLDTTHPGIIAVQNAVFNDQEFLVNTDDVNLSGQITLKYQPTRRINTFATFSTSFKSVGLNVGGLPTLDGEVLTDLATINPEKVYHYEWGIKTTPTNNIIVNVTLFNTEIEDYQAQISVLEEGINRSYLANADKVRVRGAELETSLRINRNLSLYSNLSYTEGIYKRFTNSPPAPELVGAVASVDISGSSLPGISRWAGSTGGEVSLPGRIAGYSGNFFLAIDSYYRSSFYSTAAPSELLKVPGYALFNARLGFRVDEKFSINVWSRNLLDKDYFEYYQAPTANGLYGAFLGDPRTYGITLRYSF